MFSEIWRLRTKLFPSPQNSFEFFQSTIASELLLSETVVCSLLLSFLAFLNLFLTFSFYMYLHLKFSVEQGDIDY